ncbi:MAG: glycosyltransferase [Tepidisphaera sp.]|nr:glycosyltransferase [Tepidisphaera sp.]
MISYVLPTRNRPERLKATLLAIDALGPHDAEITVVDNASSERLVMPPRLRSGVPVRRIDLDHNAGAAARNLGVQASRGRWIVMLDDDSHPMDLGFIEALDDAPPDVGALSADIFLPVRTGQRTRRESGGLPEVFIGCGVAIRRELFLELGGYDHAFNYYVEEYDLAARMLLAGCRVRFDPRFRVLHAKDSANRDMNAIVERLVRNNGWVAQRYAPDEARAPELREIRRRYRRIAIKERALTGYGAGLTQLRASLRRQPRTPMTPQLWERFTGLAAAREALAHAHARTPFRSAAIIDEGKNAWVVARALRDLGVRLSGDGEDAEVCVIGTMSPGPMLDAFARRQRLTQARPQRVIIPWRVVLQSTRLTIAA